MNRDMPWYEINVKAEVISDLKRFVVERGGNADSIVAEQIGSVRDLMDVGSLSSKKTGIDPVLLAAYAKESYLRVRGAKYGQDGFWRSARQERELAYKGEWERFLVGLLGETCTDGGRVLFVGTADGSEIPRGRRFRYYALEQLERSTSQIDTSKVEAVVTGDFEDSGLKILPTEKFDAVVALRCLMPNTRLDRFIAFVGNNLWRGGHLIASHPMARLDEAGRLMALDDAVSQMADFERRFYAVCRSNGFEMARSFPSELEQFYIVKFNGR